MKTKAVFIAPNGEEAFMPLTCLMLGGFLDKDEYEVTYFDPTQYCSGDPLQILATLREELKKIAHNDIFLFSVTSDSCAVDVHMTGFIKQFNPRAITIMGGPGAYERKRLLLKSELDIVVVGRVEKTLAGILEAIRQHDLKLDNDCIADLQKFPNMYIKRKDGTIVKTKRIRKGDEEYDDYLLNFSDFPFPDYENLDERPYVKMMDGQKVISVPYMSADGCKFACDYCSVKMELKGYGFKPVSQVIEELTKIWELYHEKYDMIYILMNDASFTIDPERTKALCDAIVEAGLHDKLVFAFFQTRIDCLDDDEMIEKLLKANFIGELSVGLESVSPGVWNRLHKRYRSMSVNKVKETLQKLMDARVDDENGFFHMVSIYMILFTPNITLDELEENLDFIEKWYGKDERFNIHIISALSAYPRTPIYYKLKKENRLFPVLLVEPTDKIGRKMPKIPPHKQKTELRMYTHPNYIFKNPLVEAITYYTYPWEFVFGGFLEIQAIPDLKELVKKAKNFERKIKRELSKAEFGRELENTKIERAYRKLSKLATKKFRARASEMG